MTNEIPAYCLRAYALFFTRHGKNGHFMQSELDWIVKQSLKKKIFSILLKSGWIKKQSRNLYKCKEPKEIMNSLLDFKVMDIMKNADKPYSFTNLTAVEIWSDFSYVLRGIEKSPYFIKVLIKDLEFWKTFFNEKSIPNYVRQGSTIGEYVILIPANKIKSVERNHLFVDALRETIKNAEKNKMYKYAYNYMKKKYGKTINSGKGNL